MSSMVANIQGYQFLVQKAPPQAHESVGHAERAIRSVKEAVKTATSRIRKVGIYSPIREEGNPSSVELCVFFSQLFFSGAGFQEDPEGDFNRVSDSSSQFFGFWVESVGGVTPKFD